MATSAAWTLPLCGGEALGLVEQDAGLLDGVAQFARGVDDGCAAGGVVRVTGQSCSHRRMVSWHTVVCSSGTSRTRLPAWWLYWTRTLTPASASERASAP